MSNRYKGAVISATPPTTTGGESGTASGAWTLEQQMQLQAAGLWPSQPPPLFIEDVFSTYLYTGNSSTQTITNGINITGKGGLVWIKNRTNGTTYHILTDTVRGAGLNLSSNVAIPQYNDGQPTFNSTGFNLINSNIDYNTSANNYVSWTFREQPKFFDIVTYTGNQAVGRAISHSLGSIPGCVIVKCTTEERSWFVYHRSIGATKHLILNDAGAEITQTDIWNNTTPTSTTFTVGDSSNVNGNGRTYVAYLFAHNAGGFGVTESDNVISCGSFTTDGSAQFSVNLGYEPQWVFMKPTGISFPWQIVDTMRGFVVTSNDAPLSPNNTSAEASSNNLIQPTATGFQSTATADSVNPSATYIYIAIRRGPMKVPTSATTVFEPVIYTGNGATTRVVNTTITPDAAWFFHRSTTAGQYWFDRLRGNGSWIRPSTTNAEGAWNNAWLLDVQNAVQLKAADADYINSSGSLNGLWAIKRAPSFFDEVCYTGTGANRTVAHNLGVAPELLIVKKRSATSNWSVYASSSGATNAGFLDSDGGFGAYGSTLWNNTTPTSSVFTVGTSDQVNGSGGTYVAYLFATCAGVSKVGSYTGTGAAQTINCGFTAGSRFVMIKRTDSTGDWYVWDSARGIIPSNDPYLLLNSGAAEVTGTDYVDTTAVGFDITSTAPAAINANGGTFIFLAIA